MAQYALDVQTALWRVLATDETAAAMTELSANNCRSGTVHGARADIAGSIMYGRVCLPTTHRIPLHTRKIQKGKWVGAGLYAPCSGVSLWAPSAPSKAQMLPTRLRRCV
jgi:hypothetical protein